VLDDAEAGADTGLLRVDLAYALLRRGDLTEASAELAMAAAMSDEQDLTWLAVQPVAARLLAEQGDVARADELVAAARRSSPPEDSAGLSRLTGRTASKGEVAAGNAKSRQCDV
jgi:hypothetical protein